MPLDSFPNYAVSAGSEASTAARVLRKQFGDGYEQRAADGLNSLRKTYRAQFNARAKAEVDTIDNFLSRKEGYTPFLFTIPGEAAARRWTCEEWRKTRDSAMRWSLTATFVEDFGL
ncbi:MAG: phage tail protein [Gammaproteobacteria bacterium]|nr:phage tail protein [Gammaproteobacteria bacterium]